MADISSPLGITRDDMDHHVAQVISTAQAVADRGIGSHVERGSRTEAATFTVYDPASGTALGEVPDAGAESAAVALDRVCQAQEAWGRSRLDVRSQILHDIADAVSAQETDFAHLITAEMGKPVADSLGEVRYAVEFLRWFAAQALATAGTSATSPSGVLTITATPQPVGPCLLITPWNFPLAMLTRKIAPALAAGCTAIVKPSDRSPLTALLFAQLAVACGVPESALQVLPTSNSPALVSQLINDGRLRKLSFTGSTTVGRELAAAAGAQLMRTSLELGGNAAFIVAGDADVQAAASAAHYAKLRTGGQACIAANRFIVHRRIADEFLDRLGGLLSAAQVGPGFCPTSEVGPLISTDRVQLVADWVDEAVAAGGEVVCGGQWERTPLAAPSRPQAGGFIAPTLVRVADGTPTLVTHEVFAPVAGVHIVNDDDEALNLANQTPYGLAHYVFTDSAARARRFAAGLRSGIVGINVAAVSTAAAPFGGVDDSGYGREGGHVGLSEYQTLKYCATPAA